MHEQRESILG